MADETTTTRTGSDKRKQSLYFPEIMLQEIKDEAARLDRSLSWVVQRAWKLARAEIRKIPNTGGSGIAVSILLTLIAAAVASRFWSSSGDESDTLAALASSATQHASTVWRAPRSTSRQSYWHCAIVWTQ